MRIGIDVGGTHTDGVLINGSELIAAAKVPTLHTDLLGSITRVLKAILQGQDPQQIQHLNLSTTLTTNAIISGKTDDVGMLVLGGPGISAETYRIGNHFHVLPGSLNHLGVETEKIDLAALDSAVKDCLDNEIKTFSVVSKFSPRNPGHEEILKEHLLDHADFITSGHLLSGRLNFGRRVYTSYYNSAVWRSFADFIDALKASLATLDINAEINILKADGGTMSLSQAMEAPVQSIFSGPAASVMGILATDQLSTDGIMLDIGGTTTDIALFATGEPLLEREGIAIEQHPTLVRAVQVTSIGIGGDSQLKVKDNTVLVGPERSGPCMADGGENPTLMDAMNYLQLAAFGNTARSCQGIENLAQHCQLDAKALAQQAVDMALTSIETKINALINEVNSKPVYTIHEMLEERTIIPSHLVVTGGPAAAFTPLLQDRLNIKVTAPLLSEVANAVGAALTRPTMHLVLEADTSKRQLNVPTLGISRSVDRKFNLDDATTEATALLCRELAKNGSRVAPEEIQIIQADSFNMVDGSYTAGKNIRVVAQIQAAVTNHLAPIPPEMRVIYD